MDAETKAYIDKLWGLEFAKRIEDNSDIRARLALVEDHQQTMRGVTDSIISDLHKLRDMFPQCALMDRGET